MQFIALYTDFGLKDEYVGVMKGVIFSIAPMAKIIDIIHYIDPQDIVQAAYILKSSYSYCPNGTIHLLVVDPGVGTFRSIIACSIRDHIFLFPDNGICTLLLDEYDSDVIVKVENKKFFLGNISQTFHGRDIFAPVAAHLANGMNIKELGTSVKKDNLIRINFHKPIFLNEGKLEGKIISIDRFGNLMTNFDIEIISKLSNEIFRTKIIFEIDNFKIYGIARNYQNADKGQPVALLDSRGYIEIAVNCGSAEKYFNAKKGDVVIAMNRRLSEN